MNHAEMAFAQATESGSEPANCMRHSRISAGREIITAPKSATTFSKVVRSLPAPSAVALASVFTVAFCTASASTINQFVDFQVSNQPIWGGSAPQFEVVLAEAIFKQSVGIDQLIEPSLFGASLGKFGIAGGVTVDVATGMASRLSDFHLGMVNVVFPINVTLNFPDRVNAGETFRISSSYAVAPGATFTSTADQSTLKFGTTASHIAASATAKACIVTCLIDEMLQIPRLDIPALDLITQTRSATTINIDLPGYGKPTIPGGGIDIDPSQDILVNPVDALLDIAIAETTNISGKITVPHLSQTGGLTAPATLSGKAVDVFADIKVDLDSFLSPPLPPLGFGPFTVGGARLGADIFDASFVAKMVADQALQFLGAPKVIMDLGSLGIVDLLLGGSVDITAPANVGELQITPTYVLGNAFTNTTIVAAAKRTDITVGSVDFHFPKVTVFDGTAQQCVDLGFFDLCTPGIPPINVGPFDFEESIFGPKSVPDVLIDSLLALSTGSCQLQPLACRGLDLLRPRSNSQMFFDQQSFEFNDFAGRNFAITVDAAAVPEPPSFWLVMLGLIAIALPSRRRIPRLRTLSARQ